MNHSHWLLEMAQQQESFEISLGDTLDMKTSVALVALTFEGTLAAQMLSAPTAARSAHVLAFISCAMIVAGAAMAFAAIRTRRYRFPPFYWEIASWLDECLTPENTEGQLSAALMEHMKAIRTRMEPNRTINNCKSWSLKWCLRLTMVALVIQVAGLIQLAISMHF